jgi:predicted nucleotidyltransferase
LKQHLLNSGHPVGDQAMARRQVEMRDGFVARIAEASAADDRVQALWLIGSLARGDEDCLSDIDVVVSTSDTTFVYDLSAFAETFDTAGLVHESPQNAPAGGAQINVLYDTLPLPIYVDWSVWPLQERRPNDVRVLLERDAARLTTDGSFAEIVDALPKPEPIEVTPELLDRFRLFMIPIVAKEAARGWTESVVACATYMRIGITDPHSFPDVVRQLREVLAERSEPTVERYLSQLETLIQKPSID